MSPEVFYALLIAVCLAALSGYFFVWRVLGRIASRVIGFLAKGVLVAILLLSAYLFAPKYIQGSRPPSASEACFSNCERICTALDRYAGDHDNRYPSSLEKLAPRYIISIPTCPAAEKDTYTPAYTVSRDQRSFTLYCTDSNHHEKKFRRPSR